VGRQSDPLHHGRRRDEFRITLTYVDKGWRHLLCKEALKKILLPWKTGHLLTTEHDLKHCSMNFVAGLSLSGERTARFNAAAELGLVLFCFFLSA
jgi:hypothetical protein